MKNLAERNRLLPTEEIALVSCTSWPTLLLQANFIKKRRARLPQLLTTPLKKTFSQMSVACVEVSLDSSIGGGTGFVDEKF